MLNILVVMSILCVVFFIGFVVMSIVARNAEYRFNKVNQELAEKTRELYLEIDTYKKVIDKLKEINAKINN